MRYYFLIFSAMFFCGGLTTQNTAATITGYIGIISFLFYMSFKRKSNSRY